MKKRNEPKTRRPFRGLLAKSAKTKRRRAAPVKSDTLSAVLQGAKRLLAAVKRAGVVQISSAALLGRVKVFVQMYFRELRPELAAMVVATDVIDGAMQDLLRMANAHTSAAVYARKLSSIIQGLGEAEVAREYSSSQAIAGERVPALLTQHQDERILGVLDNLVPSAGRSYRQALADMQTVRASYRGTATDLREVLREVLDHLAPDGEVMNGQGFRLENGRQQPTMKQKVQFILRSRGMSATAMDAPKTAADIIDDSVARLARAVYERGSLSAHTHQEGLSEVRQIKMYLDSVLSDLLELNRA